MKKYLIAMVILVAIVAAVYILLPKTPGAIVFDLKYRGLSGEKDELRYNSFWGFGGGPHETPFLSDLKKKIKDFETVYNPNFVGAEWSAVEIKDNKVVALYIDLNTDGKVSDNEKILPIQNPESSSYDRTEFVTPDFVMKTRDNR
ncbi:MAG: hypothetical protein ACYS3S_01845, partial [Planctomycetota bacterium]